MNSPAHNFACKMTGKVTRRRRAAPVPQACARLTHLGRQEFYDSRIPVQPRHPLPLQRCAALLQAHAKQLADVWAL